MIRLHLGCGERLLEGWINMDLLQKEGIVNHDLRNPLPYKDGEVDMIYSEHFIEHLSFLEGFNLLKECYRILNKRSGIIRLSTPDLAALVDAYSNNDITRYAETGWVPASRAQMFNEGMREWGHQFLYDEKELVTVMNKIGFRNTIRLKKHVGTLDNLESRPDCKDLIIEALP